MKAELNRQSMATALSAARHCVPPSSLTPILCQVLLDVGHDSVKLSANNREIGVTQHVQHHKIEEPGSVLLSYEHLLALISRSKDSVVSVETTENCTKLKIDRSIVSLASHFDVRDYPRANESDSGDYYVIESGRFKILLQRTCLAAFGEVELGFLDGTVRTIAMDGCGMVTSTDTAEPVGGPLGGIVPIKAIDLVLSLLPDGPAPLRIGTTKNSFVLVGEGFRLDARLLDRRLARWQDAIPNGGIAIDVPAGELLQAVRLASATSDPELHGVGLTLSDKRLILSSSSTMGSGEVEITVTDGSSFGPVFLDHRYLSGFLGQLPADEKVRVDFGGNKVGGPVLVKYGSSVCVLTPLARI